MSNARLMIKMRDGALAWTERHWYWGGTPSPTAPFAQATPAIADVVAAAKVILPLRKLMLNGTTSTMIGAVISYDDSDRDGYPIDTSLYPYATIPAIVEDPEISVMVTARSVGNVAGPSYNSQFYIAPVNASNVNDQTFLVAGPFATALANYLNQMQTIIPSFGWGWKGIAKNPPNVPLSCTNVAVTYNVPINTSTLTLTLSPVPASVAVNQIVRLSGIVQGRNSSPKLNGRWYIADITGTTLTLMRKYWPQYTSAASVNRIGNPCGLTPAYYQILPYSQFPTYKLVKKDRGGTLGLSRGRSRGSRAYV